MAEPTTIEVNDLVICSHYKEVCDECGYDGREDNDGFYGFDHTDRDPLEIPALKTDKDGAYQCVKHGSPGCNQCFAWKKQITRARTAAKKAGRK
ncbi:hypothetical protein FRB95_012424 [Tulasnella sp. JGI-2019a]|nr:hypothetical protein FRB95_012424 [Tulasnella sp. JGI-2019a]